MSDYAQYERLKAAWIESNPTSTPAEYQAAIRLIAFRCGV